MLTIKTGNLLKSNAQTLVNTVNCVGVMGKGIALEFKNEHPSMFKDYASRCARGEVKLGEPYLFRQLLGPWILNFPTKDHWRSLTRLEDVVTGLELLAAKYEEWGITSIAVPPLGCGNGQLEWTVVGPTLYKFLGKLNIPVELYAPQGTPINELSESFLSGSIPAMTRPALERLEPGWLALVEIVHRINQQPLHRPVGRTVFQKIAYVATRLGISTKLHYERNSYGPFAKDLKRIESQLINNGLLKEQKSTYGFAIESGRTFEDARLAFSNELSEWESEISRTTDLFMRIRSANQAELVATVLYVTDELTENTALPSESQVFEAVLEWKARRNPPINRNDLAEAIRGLASQQWIAVEHSAELPISQDLSFA